MAKANLCFLDGSGPADEHDLGSFQNDPDFRTLFGLT
jgi:hypothetical protein